MKTKNDQRPSVIDRAILALAKLPIPGLSMIISPSRTHEEISEDWERGLSRKERKFLKVTREIDGVLGREIIAKIVIPGPHNN
jgi:hypothetical protein